MKKLVLAELNAALERGDELKGFDYTTADEFISHYWREHPRFHFFKGIVCGGHLLDSGCGSGGLAFWRNFAMPQRSDMRISGVDLMPNPQFAEQLERFVCQDLNQVMPFDGGSFDAALSSHVIEHIDNREVYVSELARVLKHAGLLYIECPSPASALVPPTLTLAAAGKSMKLPISNFFDDATHLSVVSETELAWILKKNGFAILQSGAIYNEYVAKALLAAALRHDNLELATYGLWLLTGWSHYAIAVKQD